RIFVLWEAFQPEPNGVDETALGRLGQFADLAAAAGVKLQPTLFTGHMSGANWLPAFATTASAAPGVESAQRIAGRFPTIVSGHVWSARPANFYAEERLIRAQELLA